MLVWALFIAILRSCPGRRRAAPVPRRRVHRPLPRPAGHHRHLPRRCSASRSPDCRLCSELSPTSSCGVIALTLVYGAYVAEVYRAGIESIHWSQTAAARSLGLSYGQTMRYVIVPQAVRRIIPPLLNDFIGLQKDTALVSVIGALDAFNRARITASNQLQPLGRHRRGDLLRRHHDPAGPPHRLPGEARPAAHASATDELVPRGRRRPQALRRQLRCCAASTCTSTSTRWCASSARRAAASRRCCAASTRLETIDGGEIRIEGDRVTGPGVDLNWLRHEVGIVFQSFNLFPHMTVLDERHARPVQGPQAAARPTPRSGRWRC